jgi:hypothetical protein
MRFEEEPVTTVVVIVELPAPTSTVEETASRAIIFLF